MFHNPKKQQEMYNKQQELYNKQQQELYAGQQQIAQQYIQPTQHQQYYDQYLQQQQYDQRRREREEKIAKIFSKQIKEEYYKEVNEHKEKKKEKRAVVTKRLPRNVPVWFRPSMNGDQLNQQQPFGQQQPVQQQLFGEPIQPVQQQYRQQPVQQPFGQQPVQQQQIQAVQQQLFGEPIRPIQSVQQRQYQQQPVQQSVQQPFGQQPVQQQQPFVTKVSNEQLTQFLDYKKQQEMAQMQNVQWGMCNGIPYPVNPNGPVEPLYGIKPEEYIKEGKRLKKEKEMRQQQTMSNAVMGKDSLKQTHSTQPQEKQMHEQPRATVHTEELNNQQPVPQQSCEPSFGQQQTEEVDDTKWNTQNDVPYPVNPDGPVEPLYDIGPEEYIKEGKRLKKEKQKRLAEERAYRGEAPKNKRKTTSKSNTKTKTSSKKIHINPEVDVEDIENYTPKKRKETAEEKREKELTAKIEAAIEKANALREEIAEADEVDRQSKYYEDLEEELYLTVQEGNKYIGERSEIREKRDALKRKNRLNYRNRENTPFYFQSDVTKYEYGNSVLKDTKPVRFDIENTDRVPMIKGLSKEIIDRVISGEFDNKKNFGIDDAKELIHKRLEPIPILTKKEKTALINEIYNVAYTFLPRIRAHYEKEMAKFMKETIAKSEDRTEHYLILKEKEIRDEMDKEMIEYKQMLEDDYKLRLAEKDKIIKHLEAQNKKSINDILDFRTIELSNLFSNRDESHRADIQRIQEYDDDEKLNKHITNTLTALRTGKVQINTNTFIKKGNNMTTTTTETKQKNTEVQENMETQENQENVETYEDFDENGNLITLIDRLSEEELEQSKREIYDLSKFEYLYLLDTIAALTIDKNDAFSRIIELEDRLKAMEQKTPEKISEKRFKKVEDKIRALKDKVDTEINCIAEKEYMENIFSADPVADYLDENYDRMIAELSKPMNKMALKSRKQTIADLRRNGKLPKGKKALKKAKKKAKKEAKKDMKLLERAQGYGPRLKRQMASAFDAVMTRKEAIDKKLETEENYYKKQLELAEQKKKLAKLENSIDKPWYKTTAAKTVGFAAALAGAVFIGKKLGTTHNTYTIE